MARSDSTRARRDSNLRRLLGAVIAYVVVGVLALGALVAWVQRRKVAQ